MTLTAYKKVLAMSKEQIDASLANARAATAQQKAILEMAKIDEAIATQEGTINELCSKKDLDFDAILNGLDEIDLATRRKAQFQKLVNELFPTEATPTTTSS
jgi:hypothetical protein